MKKLVINAIMALIAFKAAAIPVSQAGPLDVQLTVLTEAGPLRFNQISSKTNSTATATNITTLSKATIDKTQFDGADLLALMANSFNTNFPPGSQVGMILQSTIAVVDATGTNIIFAPPFSAVHLSGVFPEIESGIEVDTTTIDASGSTQSGYGTVAATSVGTLTYDDTGFTTVDGTQTQFTFTGTYVQTNVRPKGKDFVIVSGQLQGAGDGTVRGKPAVLTGTLRLKPFHAVPQD